MLGLLARGTVRVSADMNPTESTPYRRHKNTGSTLWQGRGAEVGASLEWSGRRGRRGRGPRWATRGPSAKLAPPSPFLGRPRLPAAWPPRPWGPRGGRGYFWKCLSLLALVPSVARARSEAAGGSQGQSSRASPGRGQAMVRSTDYNSTSLHNSAALCFFFSIYGRDGQASKTKQRDRK